MNRSKWDRRIERAAQLAAEHPFAAEVLHFYQRMAVFQQTLYSGGAEVHGDEAGTIASLLQHGLNVHRLLPKFAEFLSAVEKCAPRLMADSARDLSAQEPARWGELLDSFWRTAADFEPGSGQPDALLAWIFLQPQGEYLADRNRHISRQENRAVCPFCSGKPIVGVLRPEGDGAKRSLICAMCATEWACGRIICPACGEQDVEKLAVYTASQFDHVRVEACDTCHVYIKTVDLTKNGRAVPVVDELATTPLNLWAQQHGYRKLRANLLGI